ncbi:hypothetical protein PPERSA_01163 [Pseudocohnilembus persalinus]|uniref:Uncharacterized protein n=1 Tax=Pseudocohnilembus persalinus TaxID=266149 RepID=A0A0V0R125_PSEPJ|nr:hypothetical protein PPERSA_01163 [Pseudocohnilembus persalinus]|eukprot:KRX08233.1 hypothetical protein PPERSA_01163 [Pseudocohnilembus persalinus]
MDPEEVSINLPDYLSSSEKYKLNVKPIKYEINENKNEQIMKAVVETVNLVINDDSLSALTKLNAIRLIKETNNEKSDTMFFYTEQNLLDTYQEIALYKKEIQMDDRGKTYFDGHDQQQEIQILGNSFLRLVLECIFVWSQWHKSSKVNKIFKELKYSQNVRFPPNLNYFKEYNQLIEIEQIEHEDEEDLQVNDSPNKNDQNHKNSDQKSNQDEKKDEQSQSPVKTPQYNQQSAPYNNRKEEQGQNSENNQLYSTQNSVLDSYKHEVQRNSEKYKLRGTQSNLRPQSPNSSNIHNNSLYSSKKSVSNTLMISRGNVNTSRQSIQDEKKLNKPFESTYHNKNSAKNNKFDLNIVSKYGVSNASQKQASGLSVNKEVLEKPGFSARNIQKKENQLHNINSNISDNNNNQEISRYLSIIEELTQERDKYKALYEQDNANLKVKEKQLKDLQKEKEELEQENMKLLKQSVPKDYNYNQY